MPTIKQFEDIRSWQKARQLDQKIFKLTQGIERDYRFVSQWLSASGSVMDNIAEGFDREGTREFIQFLSIAKGSTAEVRSQAYRALDRGYIDQTQFGEVYDSAIEIKNLIAKLMSYSKECDMKGVKYK
ncbi:four helix bundle protein [Spirosoma fluminis]